MTEISTSSLIKGAGSLVIALSWNEAAKKTIDYLFPDRFDTQFFGTLFYAISVTLLVLLFIMFYNFTSRFINDNIVHKNNTIGKDLFG